jgi:hypothetical protein
MADGVGADANARRAPEFVQAVEIGCLAGKKDVGIAVSVEPM